MIQTIFLRIWWRCFFWALVDLHVRAFRSYFVVKVEIVLNFGTGYYEDGVYIDDFNHIGENRHVLKLHWNRVSFLVVVSIGSMAVYYHAVPVSIRRCNFGTILLLWLYHLSGPAQYKSIRFCLIFIFEPSVMIRLFIIFEPSVMIRLFRLGFWHNYRICTFIFRIFGSV